MTPTEEISVAIVDDDESVCRSLGRLLRAEGMASAAYLSAEVFLEREERPPFDCLLIDVQLSGTSGLELQRQLVAAGDRTPVIFHGPRQPQRTDTGAGRRVRGLFS